MKIHNLWNGYPTLIFSIILNYKHFLEFGPNVLEIFDLIFDSVIA
jgi:hypothetical protein